MSKLKAKTKTRLEVKHPFLAAFKQRKDLSGMTVEAPQFGSAFVIEESLVYAIGETFFGVKAEDESGLVSSSKFYTFPPMQYINNKQRLVRILWLPFEQWIVDTFKKTMSEHYVCYDKQLTNNKWVCFPVRVQKDITLNEVPISDISASFNGIPTFAMEKNVMFEIEKALDGYRIPSEQAWFQGVFNGWTKDNPPKPKFINCIQFPNL